MIVSELAAGHILDAGGIGRFRVTAVDPPDELFYRGLASRWQVTCTPMRGAHTGEPVSGIVEAIGAEFGTCQSVEREIWVFYWPDGADVKVVA